MLLLAIHLIRVNLKVSVTDEDVKYLMNVKEKKMVSQDRD